MFTEVHGMHTDLFGEYRLVHERAMPFRLRTDPARIRIFQQIAERQQTDLEVLSHSTDRL